MKILMSLVVLSVLGFIGNNCLAKFVGLDKATDPFTYTMIRLASGILAVAFLPRCCRSQETARIDWDVKSGIALAVYAFPFAYAYLSTSGGVGALILFMTALVTIFVFGWLSPDHTKRPNRLQRIGIALAFAMLFLMIGGEWMKSGAPGWGELIMLVAGGCWGYYVVRGKDSQPAAATLGNFIVAFAFGLPVWIVYLIWHPAKPQPGLEFYGVVCALVSGAFCSGIAYVAWYHVVSKLNDDFQSGVIQLSVPIFVTAVCAGFRLGKPPTLFQFCSGMVILIGALIFYWFSPKNRLRRALSDYIVSRGNGV
jgi:drug/metabolite transporter (DMT)-like permease